MNNSVKQSLNIVEQNEILYQKLKHIFEPNWYTKSYKKKHFSLTNKVLTEFYQKEFKNKEIKAQFWIDSDKDPNRLDFELVRIPRVKSQRVEIINNLRECFMEGDPPDFLWGSTKGTVEKIMHADLPEELDERSKRIRKLIKYIDKVIMEIKLGNDKLLHSALVEDGYFRESPEKLLEIIPKHNILSNKFSLWLRSVGINNVQEENFIDVLFEHDQRKYIAELKIVYGTGTTKSIREAFGQLLEYNFYKGRIENDEWMIILDKKPIKDDLKYIDTLIEKLNFPIRLGWPTKKGFKFYPPWEI